eukprot:NODE_206_length_14836_cov_0.232408.p4 type:complete len:379 gc:universal NODE_206_length_14836_cov_0.232408:7091-8227(+)
MIALASIFGFLLHDEVDSLFLPLHNFVTSFKPGDDLTSSAFAEVHKNTHPLLDCNWKNSIKPKDHARNMNCRMLVNSIKDPSLVGNFLDSKLGCRTTLSYFIDNESNYSFKYLAALWPYMLKFDIGFGFEYKFNRFIEKQQDAIDYIKTGVSAETPDFRIYVSYVVFCKTKVEQRTRKLFETVNNPDQWLYFISVTQLSDSFSLKQELREILTLDFIKRSTTAINLTWSFSMNMDDFLQYDNWYLVLKEVFSLEKDTKALSFLCLRFARTNDFGIFQDLYEDIPYTDEPALAALYKLHGIDHEQVTNLALQKLSSKTTSIKLRNMYLIVLYIMIENFTPQNPTLYRSIESTMYLDQIQKYPQHNYVLYKELVSNSGTS